MYKYSNWIKSLVGTAALLLLISCGRDALIDQQMMDEKSITSAEIQYDSKNWQIRKRAIENLAVSINRESPNPRAVRLILKATYDIYPSVKIEALNSLSGIYTEEVYERVVKIASSENNPNVKWYALNSLAMFKNPMSAPVFIKGFRSSDWLIREASIKGMLMIEDITTKRQLTPYIVMGINDPVMSVQIVTLKNSDIYNKTIYREIKKNFYRKKTGNSLLNASLIAIKGYKLDQATREKIINLLTHHNTRTRILALRVLKEEQKLIELDSKIKIEER